MGIILSLSIVGPLMKKQPLLLTKQSLWNMVEAANELLNLPVLRIQENRIHTRNDIVLGNINFSGGSDTRMNLHDDVNLEL